MAQQAYALGVQAYIWGYPMVVMQKSRDYQPNIEILNGQYELPGVVKAK